MQEQYHAGCKFHQIYIRSCFLYYQTLPSLCVGNTPKYKMISRFCTYFIFASKSTLEDQSNITNETTLKSSSFLQMYMTHRDLDSVRSEERTFLERERVLSVYLWFATQVKRIIRIDFCSTYYLDKFIVSIHYFSSHRN